MAEYASVRTDYFIATANTPWYAKYAQLWGLITKNCHRASGVMRYTDTTLHNETGLTMGQAREAREWLEASGRWYIVGGWLWLMKRSQYELLTTKATPNVKMVGSAAAFLTAPEIPDELKDAWLIVYGDLLDRVSIDYRRGIQLSRVTASVSVSVSVSETGTDTEPPPEDAAAEPVAVPKADVPEPVDAWVGKCGAWVAAYYDGLAAVSPEAPRPNPLPGDRTAARDFIKHYNVPLDIFAATVTASFKLGRHCPKDAFTLQGFLRNWRAMVSKTAPAPLDEKIERRARALYDAEVATLDRRIDEHERSSNPKANPGRLRELRAQMIERGWQHYIPMAK